MAETKYSYSISGDFSNQKVAADRLGNEIEESGISTEISFIETNGDICDIWFVDALTAGDETTLDSVVANHGGDFIGFLYSITNNSAWNPVDSGSVRTISNDISVIEYAAGTTSFSTTEFVYLFPQNNDSLVCNVRFILKESGTGSNVRIGAKAKFESVGDSSSGAFTEIKFVSKDVNFDSVGEIFEVSVNMDASDFKFDDIVVLHIGRDGNNEMGAGTNDDVSVPIQIVSVSMGIV